MTMKNAQRLPRRSPPHYSLEYMPLVIPYAEKIHDDAGKRTLMNLRDRFLRATSPCDGMTDLPCTYPIMNSKLTETSAPLS